MLPGARARLDGTRRGRPTTCHPCQPVRLPPGVSLSPTLPPTARDPPLRLPVPVRVRGSTFDQGVQNTPSDVGVGVLHGPAPLREPPCDGPRRYRRQTRTTMRRPAVSGTARGSSTSRVNRALVNVRLRASCSDRGRRRLGTGRGWAVLRDAGDMPMPSVGGSICGKQRVAVEKSSTSPLCRIADVDAGLLSLFRRRARSPRSLESGRRAPPVASPGHPGREARGLLGPELGAPA